MLSLFKRNVFLSFFYCFPLNVMMPFRFRNIQKKLYFKQLNSVREITSLKLKQGLKHGKLKILNWRLWNKYSERKKKEKNGRLVCYWCARGPIQTESPNPPLSRHCLHHSSPHYWLLTFCTLVGFTIALLYTICPTFGFPSTLKKIFKNDGSLNR